MDEVMRLRREMRKVLSRSGSELFTNQLPDNYFWGGLRGFSFDTQPVGREIVNQNKSVTLQE